VPVRPLFHSEIDAVGAANAGSQRAGDDAVIEITICSDLCRSEAA